MTPWRWFRRGRQAREAFFDEDWLDVAAPTMPQQSIGEQMTSTTKPLWMQASEASTSYTGVSMWGADWTELETPVPLWLQQAKAAGSVNESWPLWKQEIQGKANAQAAAEMLQKLRAMND
eukprot:CAMPEP_0197658126 /NCGR_PEP_ID=MMETSP1338-20131121/45047_1 /TAXON_ID=43686 ORGANISM="Pelagodinium beii, Strain RCC1491" /NCGR_SAMPLE_ID=MMETSP1338 /ASSEMBLY_ACC=CAM_ASM_000754 /LENGTH=119 /DNA_ID=CAMNT_0043234643 /DNA_START=37 /DNA_END=396 /DNA_ORIENTATION=+